MTTEDAVSEMEEALSRFAANQIDKEVFVFALRLRAKECRADAADLSDDPEAAVLALATASNWDRLAEHIESLPELDARDYVAAALLNGREGEFV